MAKKQKGFMPRKTAAAMKTSDALAKTHDSFQNFMARVGVGTDNLSTYASYGFNPISRNRTLLEWMYRGSWLVGAAVDCVADDMTRAGIEITSSLKPGDIDKLHAAMTRLQVWQRITSTIKWSRLFGGAISVLLIDGQDPSTPLQIDRIARGAFKGILVLDRWMVQPQFSRDGIVTELGPDLGLPKFYEVIAAAPALPQMRIHYSRVLRFEGYELPYFQKLSENLWGMSVIERLYDRLTAFDSGTQGAAQLLYKAHLRVMSVEGLREIIGTGGKAMEALLQNIQMIRQIQSNESITLIDSNDKFETHQYSFGGVSDTLLQLGQQISGALQIPLVRLFGQSPAGLNSTGESDLRTYYDGVAKEQEAKERVPVETLIKVTAKSEGIELPPDTTFAFKPLWQLTDEQKANIAKTDTERVLSVREAGLVSDKTALSELKSETRTTGKWNTITDEVIANADDKVPDPEDAPPPGIDMGGGEEDEEAGKTQDSAGPLLDWNGLQLFIETKAGEIRRGGKYPYRWEVKMPADYGFIRGTASAEGKLEGMDCFVGPGEKIWIINQRNPQTGDFDEHKVMLGFDHWDDALTTYCLAYHDHGRGRIMSAFDMSMDQLKDFLANGDVTKPYTGEVK